MSLLTEAPTGRHFAQFHRDGDALIESVFAFLATGLRRGNSILVVAPPGRTDQMFERLTAGKLHPTSLCNSGQLAVLDTGPLVDLAAHGPPEWPRFRAIMAPVLSRLQPFGRGIRVYSDLSDALWDAGRTDAAIVVEDLWNRLSAAYPFSLYCGFTMDTHSEHSYTGPLEELGRTHFEILGSPDDEQFGHALDRASKEIFGISLTQMAGVTRQDGARKFPSGQRTMLWVKRNLPLSTVQLADKARQYFRQDGGA